MNLHNHIPLLRISLLIVALGTFIAGHADARAVFPQMSHNFGAFAEDDGPVTCSFPLVNEGDADLVVLSVRATCGCTQPKYPHDPIAPGDTAYIEVTYDPAYRPGRFEKNVTVETNTNPAKTKLQIRGTVIGSSHTIASRYPVDFGPLKLEHPSAVMGDVTEKAYKSAFVRAYNQSADSVGASARSLKPYLEVELSPNPIPPGEQGVVSVVYNGHSSGVYGFVEDTVYVQPEGGEMMPVPVSLNIMEDFSRLSDGDRAKAPVAALDKESYDFGMIYRTNAIQEALFTLTNNGRTPLLVRRVYSLDPGVTVNECPAGVEPGASAAIKVAVDPTKQKGGMVNAKLIIITNDPANAVQTVRMVGEFPKIERRRR